MGEGWECRGGVWPVDWGGVVMMMMMMMVGRDGEDGKDADYLALRDRLMTARGDDRYHM